MSDLPAFTNPDVEPTAELIADALAETAPHWDRLLAGIAAPGVGLTPSWRYYSDGGWLAKLLRGSKNLGWLSVYEGHARLTCYFAERHREPLTALEISERLRQQVVDQPMVGRTLPVPIDVRNDTDVDDALEVLAFKQKAR